MASVRQTWHRAASVPPGIRRAWVGGLTLTWYGAIHVSQPWHGLDSGLGWLSALLALVLMAMPRAAQGQLCWQSPQWIWHSQGGTPLAVDGVKVFDVGGLLCLRISPSNEPGPVAWRWPQWVWLCRSDPVSWQELRLALNCTPTIERRSI